MGLVVASGPAAADDYARLCSDGNQTTGCAPDNDLHIWCFGGQFSGEDLRASMRWAINNMANNTVMRESQAGNCASDTDVRWQEVDSLPVGVQGVYVCTDEVGPGHPRQCAAADARIDTSEIQRVGNDSDFVGSDGNMEPGELDLNRDRVTCHELGHSLGFQHHHRPYYEPPDAHDKDCMYSDWAEPDSGLWRRYNDHHRDHIRDFINDPSRFDGEV